MCRVCPMLERDHATQFLMLTCSATGRTLQEMITSPAPICPLGRHGPLVRWLWIVWYGVPMPIRLFLKHRLTGPLPGCGCIKPLKDLTNRETAIWNAALTTLFA
jgi:hypothetical protein